MVANVKVELRELVREGLSTDWDEGCDGAPTSELAAVLPRVVINKRSETLMALATRASAGLSGQGFGRARQAPVQAPVNREVSKGAELSPEVGAGPRRVLGGLAFKCLGPCDN